MAKAKYTYNEKRKEWYTLVYDGTLTNTGAKHRKRISSKKSSADLEKKVLAFKAELEGKGFVESSTITFGEYAEAWFNTSKATKEANTKRMYRVILDSCFDSINHVRLTNLTHTLFQQCVNLKMEHPRTCQQMCLTFKQVIKSAVRDGYLPYSAIENLTADISTPKYKKPQKRALSALEKRTMLEADLDSRKRTFVSLLYYCGLRKSEALALTPDDFDWKKGTVRISKTLVFTGNASELKPYPKSDNGLRSVPIPDACIEAVKDYVGNCKGLIFSGQNGLITSSSYKRMWESIITSMNVAAGYDINKKKNRGEKPIKNLTAHIFRHNYCTELCYQVPIITTKKIAQLLGDNEKMVLEVYSHIKDEKEDIATALKNAF